jgi:outer membrane autotransporter protein
MNIDLAGRLSDKLRITTLATGSHNIVLRRTTTMEIADAKITYALDMVTLPAAASDDEAVLSVTSDEFEMGAHTYRLYRGDGGGIMPETNKLYLSGGNALSRAGDAIYWTAAVAGLDWHYSLDSLRKRMGEMRLGAAPAAGSLWVTANTYRLNAGAGLAGDGFRQDSLSMTAGGDRRIDLPGGLALLAGGFVSIARHDRDFDNHGSGETSGLGLGGYATVLHKDGWYGDFVLRADRNSNKLHAQAVDGFITDARYGSEALGASLELGRHLTSGAGGALWLEPSVQLALARLGGENYATERPTGRHEPIAVRIDGSTAAQYRLQVRGGMDVGRLRPYLRVAEVRSETTGGELRMEGRDWTPAFDGWRFETGLGAAWLLDPESQLYFDYEYNKAPAYERPWSLTLGYRRAW